MPRDINSCDSRSTRVPDGATPIAIACPACLFAVPRKAASNRAGIILAGIILARIIRAGIIRASVASQRNAS